MKKSLALLLSSFVFHLQAFAIINGKPMSEITTALPGSAIVGITIKVDGLEDDPCSASWLTQDTLITASHCFVLNDYLTTTPKICLASLSNNGNHLSPQTCLPAEDYEVKLAPQITKGSRAPTRKLKKVVAIQIPDIVLVKIKNKTYLERFPHSTLRLAEPSLVSVNSETIVIGQGCQQFPATRWTKPEGLGTFRWQFLHEILPDKEGNIISNWNEGDTHGASCWGDSGGPMVSAGNSGGGIRGIISGMKRTLDYDQGKTTASISFYADITHPTTAKWLREQLP